MADSWLFEKGDTSVRIVRTAPMAIEVLGPGESCERRAFTENDDFVSFLQQTEEELTAFGYRLRGYCYERRSVSRGGNGADGGRL